MDSPVRGNFVPPSASLKTYSVSGLHNAATLDYGAKLYTVFCGAETGREDVEEDAGKEIRTYISESKSTDRRSSVSSPVNSTASTCRHVLIFFFLMLPITN